MALLSLLSLQCLKAGSDMKHFQSIQPSKWQPADHPTQFAIYCNTGNDVKCGALWHSLSFGVSLQGPQVITGMQLAALNQLVTDGIASGEVKPLPVTVYSRTETEEAFRYLASGYCSASLPTFNSRSSPKRV